MCRNQNFEKVTYVFRLFDFWNFFFAFPFSPFLFFLAAVIDLLLGLPALKKTSEKASSRWAILTAHEAARCSGRKFCSEFFTQFFEHFCAYLRLHWAEHSDLGITGKIFSSCRSWVQMMPILVKSDDVRRGRKAQVRHGRHRHQWVKEPLNMATLLIQPWFLWPLNDQINRVPLTLAEWNVRGWTNEVTVSLATASEIHG